MSKMYKKHYNLIAGVIAKAAIVHSEYMHSEVIAWFAQEFADALVGTSPEYDPARFLTACGMDAVPSIDAAKAADAKPILAVVLEGGLVQGIYSDKAAMVDQIFSDVVIVDYDTDGADPDDGNLFQLKQRNGDYAECFAHTESIEQIGEGVGLAELIQDIEADYLAHAAKAEAVAKVTDK